MDTKASDYLIFSGSSHPKLTSDIAEELGISLGKIKLDRFPDKEISVQILEDVRGKDTFVVQTIALDPNEYLMELLIIIDALKRASAKSISVILPYYGYCRQDRQDQPHVPITAKLVANMLETAGATRVVTMDLHAGQLEGFFDIPVDNLYAWPLLVDALKDLNRSQLVVVVPDIGSVKLGRYYANALGVNMAIVDKIRFENDKVKVSTLIGDVNGKDILLADDLCSTAGTLVSAADACQKKGAQKIRAVITHGLFRSNSLEEIENSPIELVVVSNTIPVIDRLSSKGKFKSISVAPLFASAIRRIISNKSLHTLKI